MVAGATTLPLASSTRTLVVINDIDPCSTLHTIINHSRSASPALTLGALLQLSAASLLDSTLDTPRLDSTALPVRER
eukprot:3590090-Rhodomonas_salina.1